MPADWMIGIGIAVLVLLVALVLRLITRPKEIDIVPYANPVPRAETPKYAVDVSKPAGDFRFLIQDVFAIKGRGTVVTGRVESGTLITGQRVRISDGTQSYETIVKSIESFHKKQASATVGDNVGLLLADLTKAQVKQGMLLTNIA